MRYLIMLALIGISLHAEVSDLTVTMQNSSTDSHLSSALVSQGTVDIKNDSTVQNVIIGKEDSKNILLESSIDNSILKQGVVEVNGSSLLRSSFYSYNEVIESDIKNSSIVKQGLIVIRNNATVKESTFLLQNSIEGANIENSTVSQSAIDIDDSMVDNISMSGHHTIYNESLSLSIINSELHQGKLSLHGDSSITNSHIDMNSHINNSNINNSSIDICGISISNGSNLNNSSITNQCFLDDSTINNATLIQGSLIIY